MIEYAAVEAGIHDVTVSDVPGRPTYESSRSIYIGKLEESHGRSQAKGREWDLLQKRWCAIRREELYFRGCDR